MIWAIFAAMTALAIGLLLRPLLRPSAVAAAARADYDLAVYRDQLDEIGRDVERALLSPDQAESARGEIMRRMLGAAESAAESAPSDHQASRRAAALIALVLPLTALAFYFSLGAPELPDRPYSGRSAQIAQAQDRAAFIQSMVTRLSEKLKADPSDGKGWAMLGRSYRNLGNMEGAVEAYDRALALMPKDIQTRVEYAGLLLDAAEGDDLPPKAMELMNGTLAIEPNQPDALYFVGLDAAMKGDKPKALRLWTQLLTALPPGSQARQQVQKQLDGLK